MKDSSDFSQDATEDLVDSSRDALVSALLSAGPKQPTLCEGWQTQHLAAHIHLRESTPLAAGLVMRPLARAIAGKTMQLGDEADTHTEYQELVRKVASGPPVAHKAKNVSVLRRLGRTTPVRKAAEVGNLLEFFVHTEDIRRAQPRWAPRRLSETYADALFNQLRQRARLLYRSYAGGVELVRSNGERVTAKKGMNPTIITGPAGELVMHAFGRTDHSLVLIDPA